MHCNVNDMLMVTCVSLYAVISVHCILWIACVSRIRGMMPAQLRFMSREAVFNLFHFLHPPTKTHTVGFQTSRTVGLITQKHQFKPAKRKARLVYQTPSCQNTFR